MSQPSSNKKKKNRAKRLASFKSRVQQEKVDERRRRWSVTRPFFGPPPGTIKHTQSKKTILPPTAEHTARRAAAGMHAELSPEFREKLDTGHKLEITRTGIFWRYAGDGESTEKGQNDNRSSSERAEV
ncbi:MAG TPA: hypothetical protein ENH11_00040 [Candidatus Acetothermia bacterium]|nr:hypothetical protein [Candidatus Acetothermia bacterium]